MKREKTWREFMIDHMRFDYGMYAEMWEEEHDDRRIMSNTYYQIIEALESLPANPPAWICVAVRKEIESDSEQMDGVIERYRNGLWGEPVEPTLLQKSTRWPTILRSKVTV